MSCDPAYVIADPSGICVYATDSALELIGADLSVLRRLRVDDLARPGTRDELGELVSASVARTGTWLSGTVELLRQDGAAVSAAFSLVRRASGDLVLRLEPSRCTTDPGAHALRDILEAWRRHEQTAAGYPAGTPEHILAEAEIDRLSAEYQRLAIARAAELGADR
jgi:hypothetical protein